MGKIHDYRTLSDFEGRKPVLSTSSKGKGASKGKAEQTPEERFRSIREANPDDPCVDAWDGIGCYLGDGIWGDPEYFGVQGEQEFADEARNP